MKLDYTLESPADRVVLVEQILAETPNANSQYLESLADYLILCMEKQEKKQRKVLTENRMATVNKRETSYEGLVSQLENGEDGIYNLMTENKNQLFTPKITISKQDLEELPLLRQLREGINVWEAALKKSEGRDAFIIKKALIEMRKDQYLIKNGYKKPIIFNKLSHSYPYIPLEDKTCRFDEDGYPIPEGISLLNPKICSIILCNYSRLKQDAEGHFDSDLYYLMDSFDTIADSALKPYPIYDKIVECKVDGMQNLQIQRTLQAEFGIKHSLEYISNLWRSKIPKLIASEAEDQWLNWYYLEKEKGNYKRCGRCGEIKLAHNKYFSKNKTSKDTFYSICKKCRNKKISFPSIGELDKEEN